MCHELRPRVGLKVTRQGLRADSLDLRSRHLRLLSQFERLVGVLIRSFCLKRSRLVRSQADDVARRPADLTDSLKHLIMLPELLRLFLREVLSIARRSLERQRVERILRRLLVEYVLLAVLPVGVAFRVARLAEDRLALINILPQLLFLNRRFKVLESVLGSCRH